MVGRRARIGQKMKMPILLKGMLGTLKPFETKSSEEVVLVSKHSSFELIHGYCSASFSEV
jgi:hypothetical protein